MLSIYLWRVTQRQDEGGVSIFILAYLFTDSSSHTSTEPFLAAPLAGKGENQWSQWCQTPTHHLQKSDVMNSFMIL